MPSRLAAWADRFIEASWLMVAIVIPAFFDVFSSRVFEPDKLTALRGIMLFAIGAWLVREYETVTRPTDLPSRWWQGLKANPLGLPLIVLVSSYTISTVFSVQPSVSILGSYQRLQGTLNNFLYFTLFLMVATGMRSFSRIDRLISFFIATSVPVALYGWLQHFKLDPLPWGGDVTERVAGSMGNSIFLGAYLILVIPFLVARICTSFGVALRRRADHTSPLRPALFSLLYTAIAAVVLVCIYWTGSRGTWLGLAAGMLIFMLFYALGSKRRYLTASTVASGIGVLGFLVLLNSAGSPLEPLRKSNPFFERLSTIADLEQGTNRVRVLIWRGDDIGKGVAGMVTDTLFRTIVGYGPETMYVAYNRFYPPDLAHFESRSATPDRSHNDLLDFLVTNGAIGLFAYLLMVVSFTALAYRLARAAEPGYQRFLVVAVVAAVFAHLVEALLGIAIAATRTHFYMILGIGAALPALIGVNAGALSPARPVVEDKAPQTIGPSPKESKQQDRRSRRRGRSPEPGRRLLQAGRWSPVQVAPFGFWLAVTSVFVYLLLLSPQFVQRFPNDEFPTYLVLGAFVWTGLGIFFLSLALPGLPSAGILTRNRGMQFYVIIPGLILIVLLGLVPFFGNPIIADINFKRAQSFDGASRFDLSIPMYLKSIEAAPKEDFYYLFLGRAYLESAKRAPENGVARDFKTMDDLRKPQTLAGVGRESLYQASYVALTKAYELAPLNTDHSANLGRLYRFWSDTTSDSIKRRERLDLSDQHYAQALRLSPNSAHLWTEWGLTKEAMGLPEEATAKYNESLRLDKQYSPTYLQIGNLYLNQANAKIGANDKDSAKPLLDVAASNFQKAIALDDSQAGAHSALGYIFHQQGNIPKAIEENEKVAKQAPNDLATRRNLAVLYRDSGNWTRALEEARYALNIAPADQKPQLQLLVSELEGRPAGSGS